MSARRILATLIVVPTVVLNTTTALAETVNCTAITTIPAVISVQGVYCFTANLATNISTGIAIDIQTNNVVLDLNGFKLGGLSAGFGTAAHGIHALDRQNITIKNGTVRGFLKGIFLENVSLSQGHVVEGVRNNQVVATGGTTTIPNAGATGILMLGTGPRVLNNDVINTFKQGSGTATGVNFNGATGAFAVNNRITAADRGIDYSNGATGKYRDNLTFGVTSPFTGTGTPVGTND